MHLFNFIKCSLLKSSSGFGKLPLKITKTTSHKITLIKSILQQVIKKKKRNFVIPGTDLVELCTHVLLHSLHRLSQLLSNSLTLQALHIEGVDSRREDEKRDDSDVRSGFLQREIRRLVLKMEDADWFILIGAPVACGWVLQVIQ